ncbi:hypothetical protein, partial [Legionella lansingensis]|uniref:hypothetical protein n=2 Tax=Legionella lansingensis TaxID=45067 RepID=UPI001B80C709
ISEYSTCKTKKGSLMKVLFNIVKRQEHKACGYDGRVLRTSLCPMGRVDKTMNNKKTLFTVIAHTHRLLAHTPTRLNSNYFLIATKPLKSNTYSEATTQYIFCPSATGSIEATGLSFCSLYTSYVFGYNESLLEAA